MGQPNCSTGEEEKKTHSEFFSQIYEACSFSNSGEANFSFLNRKLKKDVKLSSKYVFVNTFFTLQSSLDIAALNRVKILQHKRTQRPVLLKDALLV